jgi:hypothetical protein
MKLIDYIRHETLDLAMFIGVNPIARSATNIKPVLEVIDSNVGDLIPQEATVGKKSVPYTHEGVIRLLKGEESQIKTILHLSRTTPPSVLYTLNFVQPGWEVEFWLRMFVAFDYFLRSGQAEERSRELLSLVRSFDSLYPCVYGYSHPKGDLGLGNDPHKDDPSADKKVYEIYWLNLYGRNMVELLGRQRVLTTPAFYIEELPSGGVLFLTRPTPVDFATDEARLAQALALAHLRDDVSFDDALARLREQSATLAPVERDWDPDIADLLEPTLDSVSFSERQQEIARLNRYRPPEVSEWRTLDHLLPSDVDDSDATVARYSDLYAEQLVALLHKEIPEVAEYRPETLPRIDYHFWHFDYPGAFRREDIENDLVPAVGAYLGEMMIRNLGGHWVPRRNADESQVVIGNRAWLPFLRARHYLQSKQAAIDYSLTQFYRVAVRFHRNPA